jgi:hypothetical protein
MRILTILATSFILCSGIAGAQNALPVQRPTIIDNILSQPSRGHITIDQPQSVRAVVGVPAPGEIEYDAEGRPYLRFQGYRVQVYSGNDQRLSKNEAFNREQQIREAIPGLSTYVTFTAPFWRLRVGDFGSQEEAYYAQRQLASLLSDYAKEMYIVREDIKYPLNGAY